VLMFTDGFNSCDLVHPNQFTPTALTIAVSRDLHLLRQMAHSGVTSTVQSSGHVTVSGMRDLHQDTNDLQDVKA
jgi:hypothetical protein